MDYYFTAGSSSGGGGLGTGGSPRRLSRHRLDVLIEAEEIRRVILILQDNQSRVSELPSDSQRCGLAILIFPRKLHSEASDKKNQPYHMGREPR